jgi:hypothetical protein
MKIQLNNKKFVWYLCWGLFLQRTILLGEVGKGIGLMFFALMMRQLNSYSLIVISRRSIWSVTQVALGLYPPTSVANIFENWVNGIDYNNRILLRV